MKTQHSQNKVKSKFILKKKDFLYEDGLGKGAISKRKESIILGSGDLLLGVDVGKGMASVAPHRLLLFLLRDGEVHKTHDFIDADLKIPDWLITFLGRLKTSSKSCI